MTTNLHSTAFTHPAIDNHAHPLLRSEHRNEFPFEGLISEATGTALTKDATHTLACIRATSQLSPLLNLPPTATWDDVKAARSAIPYDDLCTLFIKPTLIHCILIDDGLGNKDIAETYTFHDRFTLTPSFQVVRIEIVAEDILKSVLDPHMLTDALDVVSIFDIFSKQLKASLTKSAQDPRVAAFKSIVCYRTGLDVSTVTSQASLKFSLLDIFKQYQQTGTIRLQHKALNDYVVCLALQISTDSSKPVQFHTGLGDSDIILALSSPARLQPLIKAYPHANFILLHSSYPYTREAGYLTAVYQNVFLDFGEVFPFVSAQGQRTIIRQVLELCPTNKILWSTDAHWWPESFYLGTIQARQALYEVLKETVEAGELTEPQAVSIVENALFHNANRVYNLGLQL